MKKSCCGLISLDVLMGKGIPQHQWIFPPCHLPLLFWLNYTHFSIIKISHTPMKLRQWLLIIRILNILTAILMIALQIWFAVALLQSNAGFLKKIVRMFMPVFIVLLSATIVTAEFQYDKVIENFKFLQSVPGLALFNLFMASLFVFEFSALGNQIAGIITAVIFVVIAIFMGVMSCLKPSGSDALLPAED